mgnify:FL=1
MSLYNFTITAFDAYSNETYKVCMEMHKGFGSAGKVADVLDQCACLFVAFFATCAELFTEGVKMAWTSEMTALIVIVLAAVIMLYIVNARPQRVPRCGMEYVPVSIDEVRQCCADNRLAVDEFTAADVFVGVRENGALTSALRFVPVDEAVVIKFRIPAGLVPLAMMMHVVRLPPGHTNLARFWNATINVFHREHKDILYIYHHTADETNSPAGFKTVAKFGCGNTLLSRELFHLG